MVVLLVPELRSSVPVVTVSGLLMDFNLIAEAVSLYCSRFFCSLMIFLLLWNSSISDMSLSMSLKYT